MNIVDLEQDVFGKHQCTKTFVGLVNFLSSQGIIQPTAEELPSSLQSFKDALSDKNSSSNIKLFILKVITECREIFQQYAKHFLGDILRVIMMPETWPRGSPMINYFSLDILVSIFSRYLVIFDRKLRVYTYVKGVFANYLGKIKTIIDHAPTYLPFTLSKEFLYTCREKLTFAASPTY